MRAVFLLLLAAGAASADFITIRSQPMVQASGEPAGTLFVVNSQSSSFQDTPRLSGLLSGFQLQPALFQGDAAGQDFPSVFSSRFFNSDLSSWIDQQIAALDALQPEAAVQQPAMPAPARPLCPRMAAMRAAQAAAEAHQAALPQDALSYLASQRFGPGALYSLAQPTFDDEDDSADDAPQYLEDANMEDDWQLTSADVGEDAVELVSYDYGSMDDSMQQQQQQPLATAGGGGYPAASGSRGFQPSMLSEDDGTPAYWVAATQQQGRFVELAPGQEMDDDNDRPVFLFVLEDGSLNWGFIVFLGLTALVVPVWCAILRSLLRLARAGHARNAGRAAEGCPFSRFMRARRCAQQEQFFAGCCPGLKSPLLAQHLPPLAPEKPIAEKAAPELFVPVEVASEQTPGGNFVERKNNEFVTIAYVPLKSEV